MITKAKNWDFTRHLMPWFGLESSSSTELPLTYILSVLRIAPEIACEWCDISPATLKRWEKGIPPRWAIPYIMACSGFLLSDGWEGWRIADNKLHQPQARAHSMLYKGFTQGDFRALEFTRMNYATTQHKIDDLSRENDALRKVHHKPHKTVTASNVVKFADFKRKENA